MTRHLKLWSVWRRDEQPASNREKAEPKPQPATALSPDAPLPAWATATSLLRTVQDNMATGWAGGEVPETPYIPADSAEVLPNRVAGQGEGSPRTMLWRTRDGETVSYGDTVALGLVEHTNAVGRITAETSDGRIQCILVRCENCCPGKVVVVEEDHLLIRMFE